MSKSRKQKTSAWHREHITDASVRRAREQGFRSRAAIKLAEIDRHGQLFAPGSVVIDLGAAPGSWSQYVSGKIGRDGCVIAVDRLYFEPISPSEPVRSHGVVHQVIGDIEDSDVQAEVSQFIPPTGADLVISDMAPNISGIKAVDEAQFERLLEAVTMATNRWLKREGHLLVKLFQSPVAEHYRQELKATFRKLGLHKPPGSRDRSKEIYVLAKGFKAPDRS